MNKRFIITAAVLFATVFFAACTQQPKISLQGTISGLTEGDTTQVVVLKMLNFNTETVLDTLKVKAEGAISTHWTPKNDQPDYYYLYVGPVRVASFILKQGDKVRVTASATGNAYTVEGSEETVILQEAEQHFNQALRTFDSLAVRYNATLAPEQAAEHQTLSLALGQTFVKYKQQAIRFLFSHPGAFANTAVTFYAFPGALYVFSDSRDAPLLRTVYDSLQPIYPNSSYVAALKDRYSMLERALQMEMAIDDAQVSDFPDLNLPNVQAQNVSLSSLKGKPIILAFWHSQNVNMRLDNQELLECYEQFASKGLTIYQVALDTDKIAWANILREQKLPWINVCDGKGVQSPAVTTYNITEVPTYFVIDKEGNLAFRTNNVQELAAHL